MAEYLHPGVYLEETSYRSKPIEGVSTSTAGFVGRTRTGPEADPVLVTSFPQFVREFGAPYATPNPVAGEFLGHAVKGFFDNGGRRAYIVRVLPDSAVASHVQSPTGNLLRLPRNTVLPPAPGRDVLPLSSLRGIGVGSELQIWVRSGPAGTFTRLLSPAGGGVDTFTVAGYDAQRNEVTLHADDPLPAAARLHWQHTYVLVDSAAEPATTDGPTYHAQHRGESGDELSVSVSQRDRPPVRLVPPRYVPGGPIDDRDNIHVADTEGLVAGDRLAITIGSTVSFRAVATVTPPTHVELALAASEPSPAGWTHLERLRVGNADNDLLHVASTASLYTGAVVEIDRGPGNGKSVTTIEAIDPDARTVQVTTLSAPEIVVADDPDDRVAFLRVLEMDVEVLEGGVVRESFAGLNWNPDTRDTLGHFTRYYLRALGDEVSGSRLIRLDPPTSAGIGLQHQLTSMDGTPLALESGSDGGDPDRAAIIGRDGGPEDRTGIQALMAREDIAITAVPGVTDEFVQAALITHCERMKYRFAVLDGPERHGTVTAIESHRNQYDSKYAAVYAPWLQTFDVNTGAPLWVPPSGHVTGIFARVDNDRGVHKAPANEVLRNVTALRYAFTDGEQDVLNPAGVNLSREFPGRGIRVWGARTVSSDQEWKYVNVRRLFLYLEHSIDRGTQWVVFEPNNEALWDRVRHTIESFLYGVWTTGALMGTRPEDAFFVKCDRSTMTQDDIDNGRLVCLIGVAPTNPAEFVIFRIGQFTASSVTA